MDAFFTVGCIAFFAAGFIVGMFLLVNWAFDDMD